MREGGTALGGWLENIVRIINRLPEENRSRVGICLDTAHSFAAGYNFEDPTVIEEVRDKYGSFIDVLHFNTPDAEVKLGGHLDRHRCKFGDGALSERAMERIFTAFQGKVFILEREAPVESEVADVVGYDLNIMKQWQAKAYNLAGLKV